MKQLAVRMREIETGQQFKFPIDSPYYTGDYVYSRIAINAGPGRVTMHTVNLSTGMEVDGLPDTLNSLFNVIVLIKVKYTDWK